MSENDSFEFSSDALVKRLVDVMDADRDPDNYIRSECRRDEAIELVITLLDIVKRLILEARDGHPRLRDFERRWYDGLSERTRVAIWDSTIRILLASYTEEFAYDEQRARCFHKAHNDPERKPE